MTRADAVDATTHTRRGSAASRDTVRVTVAVADSHSTRGSALSRATVRVTITIAHSHSTRGSAASRDTVRVTITVAEHPATAMPLAVRGGRRVERRSPLFMDDPRNPIWVRARVCITASTRIITASDRYRRRRLRRVC